MPVIRFDLIEGRTDAELKTLLDSAHRAMLAAFKVPERDRYQIVHGSRRELSASISVARRSQRWAVSTRLSRKSGLGVSAAIAKHRSAFSRNILGSGMLRSLTYPRA